MTMATGGESDAADEQQKFHVRISIPLRRDAEHAGLAEFSSSSVTA